MRSTTSQIRRKRLSGSLSLTLVIVAGLAANALGQDAAARPDRGIRPVGSYSATDIESISLSNGNLNLSIPLASLPAIAGGKLGLTLRASYNSKLWDLARWERRPNPFAAPLVQDVPALGATGGWRIEGGYGLAFHDSREDFSWLPPTDPNDPEYCLLTGNQFVKLILTTPDGAMHELRPLDYSPYQRGSHPNLWGYYKDTPNSICTSASLCPPGGCTSNAMRYYSFDGSFIWAKCYPTGNAVSWEVYLPDGTHIVQRNNGQKIWDRNGLDHIRIWSEYPDTNQPNWLTTHFVDQQTSREIKHVFDGTGEHVQYQTAYGTWMSIDIIGGQTSVTGKTYLVEDQFPNGAACQRQDRLGASVDVIRQIVLPVTEPGQSGRSFTFTYNSDGAPESYTQQWQGACDSSQTSIFTASKGWGSLSSMLTPAGATVRYSYTLDSVHRLGSATGFENQDLPRDAVIHKTVSHDGILDSWDYTSSPTGGSVTAHVTGQPDETTTETCYNHDPAYGDSFGLVDGVGGLFYRTNHSGKEIIERHWTLKKFYGANDIMPGTLLRPPFNPTVDAEYTTVVDPADSNNNKMSAKLYQYDYNGNRTAETDYDWFNANDPNLLRDSYGVPTQVPSGVAVLRTTTTSYYNPAPVASDQSPGSANVYARRLLADGSPWIINAAKETILGASDIRFSYDYGNWPSSPTVGNLTKEERWDNRANRWLPTTHVYDPTYGNLTSTTDPLGNVTGFVYDANTHAQPVQINVDPLNGTGSQTTQIAYDFSTGLVISQTDANQRMTTINYMNQRLGTVDPYGRPSLVVSPPVTSTVDGATYPNQYRQIVTKYYDNASPNNASQVEVISDLNQQGDGLLKTRTTRDQMGRTVLRESSEDGATYTISGRTVYETMARITYSTNPYRSGPSSTDGWTRTTRDNAGRIIEVATFNTGAQPPSTGTNGNWTGSVVTSYNAEATTTTDQAGRARKSITDGLGRLKQVVEDPSVAGYVTSYGYDALGDLISVTQGEQTRTFTYDSFSRLREAYNPEQVNSSNQQRPTVYLYDDASNLKRKTDPRGTYVSFDYDGLNRVKTKTLSTGGIWNYNYDTSTNGKGRLTSLVLQGSTDGYYYNGYDAVGKVTGTRQITSAQSGAQSYSFTYGYNIAGGMTSEVYPSGREIRTNYDSAGRIAGVKNQPGGFYYAGAPSSDSTNRIQYRASGVMSAMKLGNGKWEHTSLNARLQPTQIALGTSSTDSSVLRLDYNYGVLVNNVLDPAKNNGNPQSQTIVAPTTSGGTTTISQAYLYDALNRLSTATELGGAWSQSYGYDRYGNRWVSGYVVPGNGSLTPQFSTDFNTATNRLNASVYDTSGNQTLDAAGRTFTYDAENHQLTFNTTAGTYSYDGDGRRVKKTDSSGTTVFVYNAGGQLIAEYTSTDAVSNNGLSYLTSDHLGSTRVVTDINGNVKARHDYLPFGEELASSVGSRVSVGGYGALDGVRQKFTAKERDGESGLDYFLARYYSSAQGRFTSIDSSGPNLVDPQTLNKYRYGLNNPLRYVDPDGRYEEDVHRALTEVLALAAGFGVGTAEKIGRADQWVDDNPATSPMGMWPAGDAVEKRRKYHFTTQQRRDELWSGFESTGSPDDLGVFFHAFQDSFAHEGYGPTWGHFKAGHAPDKTYNNPGKADRMANQSFGLLVNAVGVMNNKGKISVSYSAVAWDKLKPLVQAFNRARTMEEKQKIIQQIRQLALDHHKRVTKEREEERRRHQDTVGPAA